MGMLWAWFGGDEGMVQAEAFLRHMRQMRRFAESHDAMRAARVAPACGFLAYDVRFHLSNDGGSAGRMGEDDWLLLVPLRQVGERQVTAN